MAPKQATPTYGKTDPEDFPWIWIGVTSPRSPPANQNNFSEC